MDAVKREEIRDPLEEVRRRRLIIGRMDAWLYEETAVNKSSGVGDEPWTFHS